MESPVVILTLSDARGLSHALYDLFRKQYECAVKYGHGAWLLVSWTEDVFYDWGTRSECWVLRRKIEEDAPVSTVCTTAGIKVRLLLRNARTCVTTDGSSRCATSG